MTNFDGTLPSSEVPWVYSSDSSTSDEFPDYYFLPEPDEVLYGVDIDLGPNAWDDGPCCVGVAQQPFDICAEFSRLGKIAKRYCCGEVSLDNLVSELDRHLVNAPVVYDTQSSWGEICAVAKLLTGTEYDNDELTKHIELIFVFITGLMSCSDYSGVVAVTMLYAKHYVRGSMLGHIVKYLNDMAAMDTQASVVEDSKWVVLVRNLRQNWQAAKHSGVFGHFSKILGLVVTVGLCQVSDLTFDINGFSLVAPHAFRVHNNAFDVMDAILESVGFFVERLSLCYATGTMKPLLVENLDVSRMDDRYNCIVRDWQLVRCGNLSRQTTRNEDDFARELEALPKEMKNLLDSVGPFGRKILQEKLSNLASIVNQYTTMKLSGGMRPKPFTYLLYGPSSAGKTILMDQINLALMTSFGNRTDVEFQAVDDPNDQYMSTWKSNYKVLIMDDVGNENPNVAKVSPCQRLIQVANNQPMCAVKAAVEEKGQVLVEPDICVLTTNVKHLHAQHYSICPYSIQRRVDLYITIRADDGIQAWRNGVKSGVDPDKVAAYNESRGEYVLEDIWTIDIEVAVRPDEDDEFRSMSLPCTYAPVEWRGRKMIGVRATEAMQCIIEMANKQRENQRIMLDKAKERKLKYRPCPVDGCPHVHKICPYHPDACYPCDDGETMEHENQMAFLRTSPLSLNEGIRKSLDIVTTGVFGASSAMENTVAVSLLASTEYFSKHWRWMKFVPTPVMDTTWFHYGMLMVNARHLRWRFVQMSTVWFLTCMGTSLSFYMHTSVWFSYPFITTLAYVWFWLQKDMAEFVRLRFMRMLRTMNTIEPTWQLARDRHMKWILGSCVVVAGLYALRRLYKKTQHDTQGGSFSSMQPDTREAVEWKDNFPDVYEKPEIIPLPTQKEARSTTAEQLTGLVRKNLLHCKFTNLKSGDVVPYASGLMLSSNLLLIPDHYFVQPTLQLECILRGRKGSNHTFRTHVSTLQSVKVEGADLRVCFIASGGSFRSLMKYLPEGDTMPRTQFTMLWRDGEGDVTSAGGVGSQQRIMTVHSSGVGINYESLQINTFKGLCGAPLLASRRALLFGMHVGGKMNTQSGVAEILWKERIEVAVAALRAKPNVVLTGSAECFDIQSFEKTIAVSMEEPHYKSPLRYMPKGSQILYHGRCNGITQFKSDAKVTLVSDTVAQETGLPNIYCGPKVSPSWFGWQNALEHMSCPASEYDPWLLAKAAHDYEQPLLEICGSDLWKDTTPLSHNETICGIDGKRFVDAMPMSTSIGFPLSGPKRKFIIESSDGGKLKRDFVPLVQAEIDKSWAKYAQGERAYPIAKGCKKDEILDKEKCRIFFSNPVHLTYHVRRLFLPVIRVFLMNSAISECAVGINAHGPEWQELHDHVFKHGKDRIVAGDYSKYDQRLCAQYLLSALAILIHCAARMNYTFEDLMQMAALCGDIVYAIIAYNGDLIELRDGSHTSGNSLTTILNSICNSLNLRCFFFSECNAATEYLFREVISAMTYGDDNAASPSDKVPEFTIKNISVFLRKTTGQVYTMPDKNSELTHYLPYERFEFLKRSSVYHEALGVHVGALNEKSCAKMLHYYLRNKDSEHTEEMACAMNIDTALREWFNHGPDVYEKRRQQMICVAEKHDIEYLCKNLNKTYEDFVFEWHEKYAGYNGDKDTMVEEEVSQLPE